ncbi:MAG: Hsp70 family protein [Candidatus Desulforudaceae bacterium]
MIIDQTTGRVFCGREAWRRREELRESCLVINSIKTLLCSDKVWSIAGQSWTPEVVAAQVFRALRERVEKRTGRDALRRAVVAIPVGFPAEKRVALQNAARTAGIEVTSFVSEPTAALFCHYDEVGHNTSIGVFDWGGGTLDVSVIENRNGRVKELSTSGMDVAGDYIDRIMAEWIHRRIVKNGGATLSLSFDEMPPDARDKMLAACEQAKRDLTWDEMSEVRFLNYGRMGDVHETIDSQSFSKLINPVVEKALDCFNSCVHQAGLSVTQLDCILMVGGSINLRPLSDRIASICNGKELYPADSDWSVATGAASLSIRPGQHFSAQTVGVTMSDGSLYPLLNAGELIETQETIPATFAMTEDELAANLVFSDEEGRLLGYLNVPAFGFFREKIEVRARIDKSLILSVEARSLNRSARTTRQWRYSGLRVDYQLPVTLLEMADDE